MRDTVVTLSADIFVIFKLTRYEITKFTAHEISHKYKSKYDIMSVIHDSHWTIGLLILQCYDIRSKLRNYEAGIHARLHIEFCRSVNVSFTFHRVTRAKFIDRMHFLIEF